MTNTSYETISAVLKATGGIAIDDHFSSMKCVEQRQKKIGAIAEVRGVVIELSTDVDFHPCFSFNRLYVGNDNMVHISTESAGVMRVRNGNLKDSIEAFNAPNPEFNNAFFNEGRRRIANVTYIN